MSWLLSGSGRVTFNNQRSYLKAVSAAFVEIKTTKFTKKVSGGVGERLSENCPEQILLWHVVLRFCP